HGRVDHRHGRLHRRPQRRVSAPGPGLDDDHRHRNRDRRHPPRTGCRMTTPRLAGRVARWWSQRCRDDRGSATVWMTGVTVATFLMVGLVLDGGVMLRARSDAFAIAAAAARVGAQQLDVDAAVEGTAVLDPAAAEEAAMAYLSAHGVTGSVVVSGDTVRV